MSGVTITASKEVTIDGTTFLIWVGTNEYQFCGVRLKDSLFSNSLDSLKFLGFLEDGDATYEIPATTIDQLIDIAKEMGYVWEAF